MTSLLRVVLVAVTALLVLGIASCGTSEATGAVVRVEPTKAVRLIEAGDRVVVDLRSSRAFEAGHVAGAVNIEAAAPDFEARVRGLDPGVDYLVYGRDRRSTAPAADAMARLGVEEVVDAGGFGLLALAGAALEGGGS